jgi:hypothetical protein
MLLVNLSIFDEINFAKNSIFLSLLLISDFFIEAIDKEVISQYSDPKEEVLFDEWAEVNLKGKKFGKKLLIIGKFRLFILKKTFFGKFGVLYVT